MKILLAFGTRPEAIKMCPLIHQIRKEDKMTCCVCVTGQHREMLQQVLDIFGVKPDYNLAVMRKKQNLYDITIGVMKKMKVVLQNEKPDIVLVHGDTSTTFAAALSCFYQNIPIGHVEAGLRTYNMYSPYPEEFNRQSVDLITELYFAPTKRSKENLIREGKRCQKIFVTGNTAIDALQYTVQRDYSHPLLDWLGDSRMILLTAHRRENWGKPLVNIFRAIKDVLAANADAKVIYPVHSNPMVKDTAEAILGNEPRIKLIPPLDVIDFHNLLAQAYLIITDSGGIQEEAPALGKPVLVLRDTTERPEGVDAGTLKLIGTEQKTVFKTVNRLLKDETVYRGMSCASNPYGDGHASEKIVENILYWYNDLLPRESIP